MNCVMELKTFRHKVFLPLRNHLSKRYSNFIFTDIFLMDMEQVKALDNVKAYHLKVEFDKKNDILVTIAKFNLEMDRQFMDLKCVKQWILMTISSMADKIRRKLLNVQGLFLITKVNIMRKFM